MAELESKRARTRDARLAREVILDAAEAVFAEHGFDGARIDAIAKTSGYNISLLFNTLGISSASIPRSSSARTRI